MSRERTFLLHVIPEGDDGIKDEQLWNRWKASHKRASLAILGSSVKMEIPFKNVVTKTLWEFVWPTALPGPSCIVYIFFFVLSFSLVFPFTSSSFSFSLFLLIPSPSLFHSFSHDFFFIFLIFFFSFFSPMFIFSPSFYVFLPLFPHPYSLSLLSLSIFILPIPLPILSFIDIPSTRRMHSSCSNNSRRPLLT